MTVLLQKQLTKTDLGALAVKNLRISLAKTQVRSALRGLLECAQRDDSCSTDQALEALTTAAVPLTASDPSGTAWELLLKSTYRAGHQAFFIERAGEFLRSCDAQPGDVWQLTRHASKLGMRLIKADSTITQPPIIKPEEGADEACSSDVSDQQAIPACVRGPTPGGLISPPQQPHQLPMQLQLQAHAPPRPAMASPLPSGGAAAAAAASSCLGDATCYGSCSSLASCQLAAGAALGIMPMAPPSGPAGSGERKRPSAGGVLGPDAKRPMPVMGSGAGGAALVADVKIEAAAGGATQCPPQHDPQQQQLQVQQQYAYTAPGMEFAVNATVTPAAQLPQQGQQMAQPQAMVPVQAQQMAQAQAQAQQMAQAQAQQMVQAQTMQGCYYSLAPAGAAVAWQAGGVYMVQQPQYYFAAQAAVPVTPPHHIVVTCNGLQGLLDVNDMMIAVGPGPGAGQQQSSRVLPEVFEALAGKSSTRKWRRSLVVHPGGADPSITAPVAIGEWLSRYPHLEARLPPRGSGRAAARAALGALTGDAAAKEAPPAAQQPQQQQQQQQALVETMSAPSPAVARDEREARPAPRLSDPGAAAAGAAAAHHAAPRARAASDAGVGAGGRPGGAAGGRAVAGHHHQQAAYQGHNHHHRRDPIKPRHITVRPGRHEPAAGAGAGAAPGGGGSGGGVSAAGAEGGGAVVLGPGGGAVRWLMVQCIDLSGWLDLCDFTVHMVDAKGDTSRLSPAEFEAMAGKASTRKWRRSLVVHPGGDDTRLREPVTVGEWMRRHNIQGALGPLPGSSPVPPSAVPPMGGAAAVVAAAAAAATIHGSSYCIGKPGSIRQACVADAGVASHAAGAAASQHEGRPHPAVAIPLPMPAPQPQQQQPRLHPPPPGPAPLWPPAVAAAAPSPSPSPPPRSFTPQLRPGTPAAGGAHAPAAAAAAARGGGGSRSDESDQWLDDLLLCDLNVPGTGGMATLSDLGVEDTRLVAGLPNRLACSASPALPAHGAMLQPPAHAGAGAAACGGAGDDDDAAAALIVPPASAAGCGAAWLCESW